MIRRSLIAFVTAMSLSTPALGRAHEGHGRKVMGTVPMAAADHVMLKTVDGKEQAIAVNARTKLVRGRKALKVEQLTVSSRVVVTLTVTEPPTAAQIQVGAVLAPDRK